MLHFFNIYRAFPVTAFHLSVRREPAENIMIEQVAFAGLSFHAYRVTFGLTTKREPKIMALPWISAIAG